MPKRLPKQRIVDLRVARPPTLNEGFAPVAKPREARAPTVSHEPPSTASSSRSDIPSSIKPYARGNKRQALDIASDNGLFEQALSQLREGVTAASNKDVREQKARTWQEIAEARGFRDAFCLTPDLIEQVVACLKASNYRSVPAYISIAKQEFVRRHLNDRPFPEAIALAIKEVSRSAKRGMGPAKHAAELPFKRLAELESFEFKPKPEDPAHPLPTIVLASWYLMREIEAADLTISHVSFRHENGSPFVDVYLRVQKNDPQGSGCTRTHTCTCSLLPSCLCPYHVALKQRDEALRLSNGNEAAPFFPAAQGGTFSKKGFIDQVLVMCKALNLSTHAKNGAPLRTGHVARATGAVFLAECGVELWRIQLLGRWGSEAVKLYIRDAPVKAMGTIAVEALAHRDIRELVNDLGVVKDAVQRDRAGPAVIPKISPTELRESVVRHAEPRLPQSGDDLVVNLKAKGGPKLHAVNASTSGRSLCGWRFELAHPQTFRRTNDADEGNLCLECFCLRSKQGRHTNSDTSSESAASEDVDACSSSSS